MASSCRLWQQSTNARRRFSPVKPRLEEFEARLVLSVPVVMVTPADAGVHTFAGGATLFTAGTWDITATDVAGITGAANVNVIAASAVAFAIAAPDSVQSGVSFSITVSAVDSYGNVDSDYVTDSSGVVTFTTTDSDPGVTLPGDYQFTADDAGVVTFDGVVYITLGTQDLNAIDTISGTAGSATVNVTGGDRPAGLERPPGRRPRPAPGVESGEALVSPPSPRALASRGTLTASAGESRASERAPVDRVFASPGAGNAWFLLGRERREAPVWLSPLALAALQDTESLWS
jgi:hypothetical protein